MTVAVFGLTVTTFIHKGQVGFGKVQIPRDDLGDLGRSLLVTLCDPRARSRWLMAGKDRDLCKQPSEGSAFKIPGVEGIRDGGTRQGRLPVASTSSLRSALVHLSQ